MTAVSQTGTATQAGAYTAYRHNRSGQFSPPLASTGAIPTTSLSSGSQAMVTTPAFLLGGIPSPPPNHIGETDFPGGFTKSNVLSGQTAPLADLSRGIVQIEGVAVLFDASA
ncbi:hypothetical protein ACFL5H_01715 [Candidatus Latescibacterota bacterium]